MLVIKIGGGEGIYQHYNSILQDLARYKSQTSDDIILVHGCSCEVNKLCEQLGEKPKFVISVSGYTSRRTDKKTLERFLMAGHGKVNTLIVEKLQKLGVNAIGLSGLDGRLLIGQRKNPKIIENGKKKILKDDYTGKVEQVNTGLLKSLIEQSYVPCISPIVLSYENEAITTDADRTAAQIAIFMGTEILVYLTNVKGFYRDLKNPDSFVSFIRLNRIPEFLEYATEGMKKKLLAAEEALASKKVKKVIIADARVKSPLTQALKGNGTILS